MSAMSARDAIITESKLAPDFLARQNAMLGTRVMPLLMRSTFSPNKLSPHTALPASSHD